jgi:hypothetical protein
MTAGMVPMLQLSTSSTVLRAILSRAGALWVETVRFDLIKADGSVPNLPRNWRIVLDLPGQTISALTNRRLIAQVEPGSTAESGRVRSKKNDGNALVECA